MVQPKIDTLNKTPRDVAVVIFEKNDAVFESHFTSEFVNLLDHRFARFVTRMRLACENELHRPCRIVEQSLQTFPVAKQERAAFISRETPGKADRQNFRIEHTIHLANCLG